ncbi:MAG TPA: hypothetical protein VIZ60_08990 [Rubrobacter sp.]
MSKNVPGGSGVDRSQTRYIDLQLVGTNVLDGRLVALEYRPTNAADR